MTHQLPQPWYRAPGLSVGKAAWAGRLRCLVLNQPRARVLRRNHRTGQKMTAAWSILQSRHLSRLRKPRAHLPRLIAIPASHEGRTALGSRCIAGRKRAEMCRKAILSALCKRRLGRLELGGPPLMVDVRYSDFVIIRSVVSTVYK
jgi:hypothetical protein